MSAKKKSPAPAETPAPGEPGVIQALLAALGPLVAYLRGVNPDLCEVPHFPEDEARDPRRDLLWETLTNIKVAVGLASGVAETVLRMTNEKDPPEDAVVGPLVWRCFDAAVVAYASLHTLASSPTATERTVSEAHILWSTTRILQDLYSDILDVHRAQEVARA